MDTSALTPEERRHIDHGQWFSALSAGLREGILARSSVRRLPDGAWMGTRGRPGNGVAWPRARCV